MKRLSLRIILILAIVVAATAVRAAESDHRSVVWSARLAEAAPKAGETAELIITAELPPHWIVYSSDFKADIGPQPTTFVFDKSEGAGVLGDIRAIDPKQKKDPTWDTELRYFTECAEFRQKIRVDNPGFVLRVTIKGQLCNEQDGTCTLFEEPVSVSASTVP